MKRTLSPSNVPSLQASRVPELNDLMHLQVSDWKRLGLALKLNSHELGIIEKDHQGDTKTQTLKMFEHWLKTQPDASYEQLIKSLCEIGDKTIANSLCNKYGKCNICSHGTNAAFTIRVCTDDTLLSLYYWAVWSQWTDYWTGLKDRNTRMTFDPKIMHFHPLRIIFKKLENN